MEINGFGQEKRCVICNKKNLVNDYFCQIDDITIYFLNDIIGEYEKSVDGIVTPIISDVMRHFSCLFLVDPMVANIRELGQEIINLFVVNPNPKNSILLDQLPLEELTFKENSHIILDLAFKTFNKAQILSFNGLHIIPGKVLVRLINLREINTAINDSIFTQTLNEYWGIITASLTLELINHYLDNYSTRIPKSAIGILNIISSIIANTKQEDDESDKISKNDISSALFGHDSNRRNRILNRLLGLNLNQTSYILADVKDDFFYVHPEIARFIEYQRENYRNRDLIRDRGV
ncbi:MAG: hypothetical protein HeimC3_48380 [Candidatus Heimdallarchaeota archaeon LC_3]|nr:MAG: hypothetical protein HeimC3_48380 [Candidatus Heimdallarchaeota archaeon LC_3]